MKFLSLPEFDLVTNALNFDTPDCHVTGGCDLYTTKAAGSDKKLYKNISKSLESQHAAMLQFGASLSPPQRDSLAASLEQLSRSSPFGPLSEISSRRTFAYLIATLNASHPDYDFSHVLRPADFKREKNLRRVMNNIDTTLSSVRPSPEAAMRGNSPPGASVAPVWGPEMWSLVDGQMTLKDCTVFSYQPAESPFDEDEGAIWALHYFFFNKALKRVCYVFVRGVPVMSHASPSLRPMALPVRGRGEEELLGLSGSAKRRQWDYDGCSGANKRARFWLGDRFAERRVEVGSGWEDEDDDGLEWNRGSDGDLRYGYDDEEDVDVGYEDVEEDDEEEEEEVAEDDQMVKSPPRGVSEDIAARMEIEA